MNDFNLDELPEIGENASSGTEEVNLDSLPEIGGSASSGSEEVNLDILPEIGESSSASDSMSTTKSPVLTWESGDGGAATLPDGKTNPWGGNLRIEGRKPLIRRDDKGKVSGYSTTSSMLVKRDDGRFAVVPTVVDGKELSLEDAVKRYSETGENWGVADDEDKARAMAYEVHYANEKANRDKWNDYIHGHWDDMGDAIRGDPEVDYEHRKRTTPGSITQLERFAHKDIPIQDADGWVDDKVIESFKNIAGISGWQAKRLIRESYYKDKDGRYHPAVGKIKNAMSYLARRRMAELKNADPADGHEAQADTKEREIGYLENGRNVLTNIGLGSVAGVNKALGLALGGEVDENHDSIGEKLVDHPLAKKEGESFYDWYDRVGRKHFNPNGRQPGESDADYRKRKRYRYQIEDEARRYFEWAAPIAGKEGQVKTQVVMKGVNPRAVNGGTRIGNFLLDLGGHIQDVVDEDYPVGATGNTVIDWTSNAATGIGKFGALGPASIPVFAGEAYLNTRSTALQSGKSLNEAGALGLTAGLVDGALTAAFYAAPFKRWFNSKGITPVQRVASGSFSDMSRGMGRYFAKREMLNVGVAALEAGGIMGVQGAADTAIAQLAQGQDVDLGEVTVGGLKGVRDGVLIGAVMGGARILNARIKGAKEYEKIVRAAVDKPESRVAFVRMNPEGCLELKSFLLEVERVVNEMEGGRAFVASQDGIVSTEPPKLKLTKKSWNKFKELCDKAGLPADVKLAQRLLFSPEASQTLGDINKFRWKEKTGQFNRPKPKEIAESPIIDGETGEAVPPDEALARRIREEFPDAPPPTRFNLPQNADGTPQLVTMRWHENGSKADKWNESVLAYDQNTKVTIMQEADGSFSVHNNVGDSDSAANIDEAVEKAKVLALMDQYTMLDRKRKENVIRTEATKYGKWDTLYFPTMADAADAIDKMIERDGSFYGMKDTGVLRTPDKADRTAFYVSSNGGGNKSHGVAFVILDNVSDTSDIPRILAHEHIGHGGPNAEFGGARGAQVEFAENIRSKEFEKFKRDIVDGIRKEVRADDLDSVNRNLGEVFAHYAAANFDKEPSKLDKLVSAVNGAARKLKIRKTYSAADVRTMMAKWKAAGRGEGGIVEGRTEAPERFEFFPAEEQNSTTEVKDEARNGADETQTQQADENAGRDGQQPAPQAAEGPVEVAPPRAEAPDAGVVGPSSAVQDEYAPTAEQVNEAQGLFDNGEVRSVADIQRKMKVGHHRATRIFDALKKTQDGTTRRSKSDNGGQNLNTVPNVRSVPVDTSGGKPKPKPKGNRGDNLRGYSYEDYAKTPDEGGTADKMGAELMRFARDNGGLLKMPPNGVADPMADWINNFLDGGGRKKNRGEFIALFGMKPKTGANDAIAENMPTGLKRYVEKMIERDGPGAVADWFLETRRKYREWAQGKRDAAREERMAAKDRAEEAEALESFDFDELAAARDAMDEEFANALGVVEGADEADYAALTPASLQIAKSGDTIRFDHDRKSFVFGSFDAGSGVLVVYDEDVAGMEGGKFRRAYRVTENSIEEIDDGQGNEVRADADRAGDEKGPAGGGGEAQGGAGRGAGGGAGGAETRKPEDLTLDSLTPAEQRAEQGRISDQQKKAAAREDMENRRTAPLKGSGAVNVQPEMDLGQTGQQDLFSPIAENEETAPAAKKKVAERPAEYLAWLERYKMKDTDRHFAEWQRKQAAQKPAKATPAAAPKKTKATTPSKATKPPKEEALKADEIMAAKNVDVSAFVKAQREAEADGEFEGDRGLADLVESLPPEKAQELVGLWIESSRLRDEADRLIDEHGRLSRTNQTEFDTAENERKHNDLLARARDLQSEANKMLLREAEANGWEQGEDAEVGGVRWVKKPAQKPAKTAPASAPSAKGTTTPPKATDAPQGAESAENVAQGETKEPTNLSRANNDAESAALTSIDEIERQKRESAQKVELSDEAIAEINKWIADNPNGNFADNGLRGIFDAEMERAKARNGGKVNPADVMPTLDAISVAYDSMKNNAELPKTATARRRLASVYAEWADGEALPAWADRLTDAEAKEYADLIDAALSVEGDDGGKAYRAVTGFEKRHEAASPSQTRGTAPASAQNETWATTPPKAAKPAEGGKSAPGGAPKSSAPTASHTPAKPAFKRGDRVFLKGAKDGQRVTFLKANADGTADVQVRTPGANRYAPEKVETRTVPMGDVSSTGMKDTLTGEERNAYRRGVAEQTRDVMRNDPALQRIDAAYRAAKTDAERNALKAQFAERVRALQGGVDFDTPELSPVTPAEDAAYMDAVRRGDMETAERMVREAAAKAGYSIKVFHGTHAFGRTKFSNKWGGMFLTDRAETASNFANGATPRSISGNFRTDKATPKQMIDYVSGAIPFYDGARIATKSDFDKELERIAPLTPQEAKKYGIPDNRLKQDADRYMALQDMRKRFDNGEVFFVSDMNAMGRSYGPNSYIATRSEVADLIDEHIARMGDAGVYALSLAPGKVVEVKGGGASYHSIPIPKALRKYARENELSRGVASTDQILRMASEAGFDTVKFNDIREGGDYGNAGRSTVYATTNPAHRVKSADPVTYDDAGNVIPLSQRFNQRNGDIRFDTPELDPGRRAEGDESLFDGYLDELLGGERIGGGVRTPQNPLGQVVPPPDGSVAQSIDAEIAADEARAARGAGRAQGAPPAPAPGSQGNERLDPGYEPESLGAGVKDPVSRQEIVDKFRELFSDTVAIRGKNTTRIGKYAGHYEPDAGIIRSKDPVSLRTIPHELGHHIDAVLKKRGPMRPNAVKAELIALGKKLYGGKQPAGGYQSEGFAEMVKYYLQGNEEGLKKEAPAVYSWLVNDFGKAHPDIMEKMDALRDMIDRFQNQSGDEAVRAIRAKDPNLAERIVGRLANMIKGLKLTQENWIDTGAFITKGMRASGLDKLMDWRSALKRGDVAEMNDIIENHPVLKWKLYNGKSAARAYQALAGGLTDLSGTRRYTYGDLGMATPGHAADEKLPTFKEIFGAFTPEEMDEFENYAIARIAKEAYLDKGLEFGLTKSEIAPTLAKHARNTKFRDALERYTHYKHGVLHLLVDAGAMSQEQFEEIVRANPIYVKIARRRESADLFRDRMLKKRGKAVNRRTGSGRQVEDIFDAGLVDDERVFSAAFQADLLRSLVNLGKRGEANNAVPGGALQGELSVGANWIHEVPNAQGAVRFTAEQLRKQITDAMRGAAMAPDKAAADNLFDQLFSDGKDILTVFKQKPSEGKNGLVSLYDEDGALHTYELPENNAEGWAKGLMGFTDSKKPNILEQWAQIAAAATRTGATILNPTFALRNIVRDTLHASTVNEFGFMIPGASTVQGIAMDMMGSNAKEIFDAMGIPMGSMLGESRLQSARRANRYLMSRNWFEAQWNKGVKKAIADFVGFSENGTRIKEFKLVRDYMLSHGASEKAADMLAGANALDITIDFQRGGEIAKSINRFIPFFNAGIQGLEQTARALGLLRAKEWQLETDRKRRAGRTVLQGAAWLLMLSLLAELFNRSDDDRKRKIEELKPHERWNYISFGDVRLPVPYEIGYIFSSIPRAVIAELYDGQKGAVAECLGMFRQTLPGISPTDIAFVGPALNTAMNEYWHGGTIVPEYVQKSKLSYDWYDERTSEFSKMLGKAMYKVFGQGKFSSPAHIDAFMNGITGNMYGRTLGAIGGQAELDTSRPNTWPVVGTFFRNNLTANRLVGEFYERKIELERKKGSGVATDEELAELHNAGKVAKRFAELRKDSQKAKEDKSISVTERNDRLEKIVLEMQQSVRDYNKNPSGGDETAYEIEVKAFEKANGEYKKAAKDKSVPRAEWERRLSVIREGNPLMRDDVRGKTSAYIKDIRKMESTQKKAQKAGKPTDELDARIERRKAEILDMIRAARK